MAAPLLPWFYKYPWDKHLKVTAPNGKGRMNLKSRLNDNYISVRMLVTLTMGIVISNYAEGEDDKKQGNKQEDANKVKEAHCHMGCMGIERDPNDRTKFVNFGNVPENLFNESVRLHEAADAMDIAVKAGMKLHDVVKNNFKDSSRCTDKAAESSTSRKPIYFRAKLQSWVEDDGDSKTAYVKGKGRKRPKDADSDYSTVFMIAERRLTFEEAVSISKNARAIAEFTPTSVFCGSAGTTVQVRVKRIEFLVPGTDPRENPEGKPVDDEYFKGAEDICPELDEIMKNRDQMFAKVFNKPEAKRARMEGGEPQEEGEEAKRPKTEQDSTISAAEYLHNSETGKAPFDPNGMPNQDEIDEESYEQEEEPEEDPDELAATLARIEKSYKKKIR